MSFEPDNEEHEQAQLSDNEQIILELTRVRMLLEILVGFNINDITEIDGD
jgi:hypothetical protein